MTKRNSDRTRQTTEIVAGSLSLAALILGDNTALHLLFGVPVFLYFTWNFNRPSSIRDQLIVSIGMSVALLLCLSPVLNLALNKFGLAIFWDIILLLLGVATTVFIFIVKVKSEHKKSRGVK